MAQNAESIAKLNELLKDVNICMLVTMGPDGLFRARPMGTQKKESDGDLWFFTDEASEKIAEITADPRVAVVYSEQGKNLWLSINGKAEVVKDKQEIHSQWEPTLKAWFPEGPETPGLCLIKVKAEGAEYWDNPSGKIVFLVGLLKGMLTGEREEMGENETVKL